eukprot:TRINITY_DN40732_c0_g1_i1.p1 TRINITY_DN40732_c0_g1~~TRINITY_DN40732_c0_g1_i1.p1  ORF type:complete len:318 (+),score=25.38 TRINITY_DN40732_c0_g1_i1:434-1387(+)
MAPMEAASRDQMLASLRLACRLSTNVDVTLGTNEEEQLLTCPDGLQSSIVATNSPLNAAQFFWHVGVKIPVIRFHGLYTRANYLADPTAAVLIFRFELWDRPVGAVFRGLLRHFAEALSMHTHFVFLENGEHLDYSAMVRHRAVFLFPWDCELVIFHELYSAGVPLLLPDMRWLVKWQPFIPWGSTDSGGHAPHGTESSLHSGRTDWFVDGGGTKPKSWTCLPWFENSDMIKGDWASLSADALVEGCSHFWIRRTHFMRYPHITHVGSVPDLIARSSTLDVASLTRGMLAFNAVSLRSSLRFYRWALARLLAAIPQG